VKRKAHAADLLRTAARQRRNNPSAGGSGAVAAWRAVTGVSGQPSRCRAA
jgi:hypothetical protein